MAQRTGAVDAIPPREMAERAEDVGVQKAQLQAPNMFLLAVLAGAFIAVGAALSASVTTGLGDHLTPGLSRLVAGVTFCAGLIFVVVAGAELFTGNNLIVMAWASRRVSCAQVLRSWIIVYAGNFVGAVLTASLLLLSGHYEMERSVGVETLSIAMKKLEPSFLQLVVLGVLCNALVCLAIWLTLSCRSTTDKILAILFPITAFVALGFHHSVANMYYFPAAIFIIDSAQAEFWVGTGLTRSDFSTLTWGSFLLGNLVPVTIGNIIGGSGLVGAMYWMIYRSPYGKTRMEARRD